MTVLKDHVTSIAVKPVAFSDHCALVMRYSVDVSQRLIIPRCPYWKILPFVVNDPLRSMNFARTLALTREYSVYRNDFSKWWNYTMKSTSRRFYSNEARRFYDDLRSRRRAAENIIWGWFGLINGEEGGDISHADLLRAKREIVEIEVEKLQAMGHRAKISTEAEDERVGVMHLGRIMNSRNDIQLKSNTGSILDQNETKTVMIREFGERFSNVSASTSSFSLGELPQLSDQQKSALIRPIEVMEIKNALEKCKKKKSPGLDGLTYEFYRMNFETLAPEMVTYFNGILNGDIEPCKEWTEGVVTFI